MHLARLLSVVLQRETRSFERSSIHSELGEEISQWIRIWNLNYEGKPRDRNLKLIITHNSSQPSFCSTDTLSSWPRSSLHICQQLCFLKRCFWLTVCSVVWPKLRYLAVKQTVFCPCNKIENRMEMPATWKFVAVEARVFKDGVDWLVRPLTTKSG